MSIKRTLNSIKKPGFSTHKGLNQAFVSYKRLVKPCQDLREFYPNDHN
jgi:hypothetical protein